MAQVTEFDSLLAQAGLDQNQRALIELLRRHIQALWHHVELLESALKVGSDGDIVVKGTKITIAGTGSLSLSGASIAASAGKVDFKTEYLTINGNKIATQDDVEVQIKDAKHQVLGVVRSGGDPDLIERRDELLKARQRAAGVK